MSILKTKFVEFDLRSKFNSLSESISPNNSSKLLAEMYVKKINDLTYAKKVNAIKLDDLTLEQTTLNDILDPVQVIREIRLLESAISELKIHDWYAPIANFIKEGQDFLKENENYILLESIVVDLKSDKSSKFYDKAINSLTECTKSDRPIEMVLSELKTEKWIPLVSRLFEWCEKRQGQISGKNPNFIVESVYSPVNLISDDAYLMHSNGLNIVINENELYLYNKELPQKFISNLKLQESAKLSGDSFIFYPNQKNMVEVKVLNEGVEVKLNNKVIKADQLNENLKAANAIDFRNYGVISNIERAINEGKEIKEIDFAYRVTSKMYEGLSATVFQLSDNIFIQLTNHAMKQNEVGLCESAEEAVKTVKEFMNFDISESLVAQLKDEKIVEEQKQKQISECQENLVFLEQNLAKVERVENELGVNESLSAAKEILIEEIEKFNNQLISLKTK